MGAKRRTLARGGVYLDVLREGLTELSSEALQRELWTVGPASPIEAIEQVFTDSGLDWVLDSSDESTLLPPELRSAIRSLEEAINKLNVQRPIQDVIEDPAMARVRATAQNVLVLLPAQD